MITNDELIRGTISICGLLVFCVLAVVGVFAR
jgi:hypothetical protein